MYNASLKNKWDAYSIKTTQEAMLKEALKKGHEQGLEQGLEKGKAEERAKSHAEKLKSALQFKKMGLPIEDIAKALDLTADQIEKLK